MLSSQNIELLGKFNKKLLKNEKISFLSALKIFNSMLKEYLSLKIYNKYSPLEGIDIDIKIAKIINNLK